MREGDEMASMPELSDGKAVYLRSLRAVKKVSSNRIRYTEEFKNRCMERYFHGESPAVIFREAGLDSSIIGYKRIERCIARWKKEGYGLSPDDAEADDGDADGGGAGFAASTGHGTGGAEAGSRRSSGRARKAKSSHAEDISKPGVGDDADDTVRNEDAFDALIARQVQRIDEIEQELRHLRATFHELETRSGEDDGIDGRPNPSD
ncbi:hypothetical protein KIH77_07410 [Bifidobacterium sp. 82T24]|nr:hypothetical protein [Bifidobacterium pluvialisilvae]